MCLVFMWPVEKLFKSYLFAGIICAPKIGERKKCQCTYMHAYYIFSPKRDLWPSSRFTVVTAKTLLSAFCNCMVVIHNQIKS